MAQSTTRKRPELGRHPRGYWYKKYKGRFYYFYRCDADPDATFSIEKWRHDKQYLDSDREPPVYDPMNRHAGAASITVYDLCNHWLSHKETLLKLGELTQGTWDEYKATCEFLVGEVGKTLPAKLCGPQRFESIRLALARRYNINGQSKRIGQIRSIFTTAHEDAITDTPPNFGRSFRKPSAAAFRKLRAAKGDQSFSPSEIHALLAAAKVNMRAMILLGLQAGFGNEDCAALPRTAIRDGWLTWARVKTSVQRRVPLWPETELAISKAIEHANSKGEDSLCFIGLRGKHYISPKKTGGRVTGEFVTTRNSAGVNPARTFYDLRRTFETVASSTVDQPAIDAIMGHTPSESNMPARYRQGLLPDYRLRGVVDCVREWLGGDI
ncbi:MAG TPA: integrase [Planctomycetaceae bacterium]|nr:integrase [Planctomycetaceae bacterium]